MTREEAINTVRNIYQTDKEKEALEILIPELAESEDERIRKKMIEHFKSKMKDTWCNMPVKSILAWLEKQKDKMTAEEFESSELFQLKLKTKYANGYQDGLAQKEQKPVVTHGETYHVDTLGTQQVIAGKMPQKPAEWSDTKELVFKDICNHLEVEGYSGWVVLLKALRNGEFQPKQEWSEEDEKTLDCIINVLDRLGFEEYRKSSRDQDVEEERFYYKEIQCLKKLKSLRPQPSWKPSDVCYGFKGDPDPAGVWKPSDEQKEALRVTLEYMPDTFKPRCTLMTLQDDLKKL